MDALISTFHLDWKMIVAQLVNFAIVFFVLYKFALKPLAKLMDERKERIAQGLFDAQVNAQKAIEIERVYEEELSRARAEAQKLLHQMKEEIKEKKEILMRENEHEAQTLMLSTQTQLQAQKEKIMKEAESEIGNLVILSLEKILGQNLDKEIRERITRESISKL